MITQRKRTRHAQTRRARVKRTAAALAVCAVVGWGTLGATGTAAEAQPGVPEAPATTTYFEDFQNQTATNGIRLGAYTGGPASGASTYVASPNWLPAGDQCNGWVLNSSTPLNKTVTNVDGGCEPTAWSFLQGMATAIGLYRGEALATAKTNQILSEYTNGGTRPGPGVEFQTAKPITTSTVPGHFYLISAIYGAANCESEGPTLNRGDPSLSFNLILNQTGSGPAPGTGGGTVTTLADKLNPCTDSAARVITTGGHTYHVAQLNSAGFRMPDGVTSLGVQLYNASGAFRGNDSGFDDPQILDATPQLDKAFSPSTAKVGQTSTLTFTITNTDELAAKSGWSYTDNLPSGLAFAGSPTTTCPSGSATTSGSSIQVSGDLSAGMVSCTVSVDVTSDTAGTYTNGPDNIDPINGLLPPGNATVVFTPAETPGISLVKSADTTPANYVVGHVVTYSYLVTNTGSVPLSGIALAETDFTGSGTPAPSPSCPQTTLDVGEAMTCTATYTLTQADVTTERVDNTAKVTGTPPDGPDVSASDHVQISGNASPEISIVKAADASNVSSPAEVGDSIAYTVTVTDTGNTPLSSVSVTDALLGAGLTYDWPGAAGQLAPGDSVKVTGTHALTQADIEAGFVTNSATTVGTPPDGPPVDAGPATTTTPLVQSPHLTLTKAAKADFHDPTRADDPIDYSFTITNDGNLGLHDVSITDSLSGVSAISYTWPGAAGVLVPGQHATATATYRVTQADIDAGGVVNTAVSAGTTEAGATTPSNEADTSTPITREPAITLTKTADASDVATPAKVGDSIAYEFTVTNAGNTMLTAVQITDKLAGLTDIAYHWPGADGDLAPGESATGTAKYAVTAADIAAGSVVNSATATGSAPDESTVTSKPASTTVPLTGTSPSPTPTPTPTSSPSPSGGTTPPGPAGSGGSGTSGTLAVTGGSFPAGPVALIALIIITAGAGLALYRRHRTE